ncbi:AAA family ATPase [Inquilinus limosus]|uniref:Rad50/SbcC-type AAA domain-containing protein n=1 Tax=Inquilinus limosus MP06 TaxID=1398085 RepID=A0A0A0DGI7_9PROT|nr:hypothetical protein [Inquilinus limosus]KGM36107.1 hypothetical protein P409_00200 [Inquilinus limosus MP06]
MIKSLAFEVQFASTGRALKGAHTFAEGFTSISGQNEAGKSLRLEFIRFGLFGVDALRDGRSSYTKLSIELEFVIQDVDYKVLRTLANATLLKGSEVVAKSTSVVNAAIRKLFGYDLAVFDAAHCVKQGEVEALGNMGPTARRKMVDTTIGLNIFDDLIKWTADTGNALNREAEAMASSVPQPVEPVKPTGYRPAAELEAEIATLAQQQEKRRNAEAVIAANANLVEPVMPTTTVVETAAQLKKLQDQRQANIALKTKIETQLSMLKPLVKTAAELEVLDIELAAWLGWQQHKAWLEANPKPRHDRALLEKWLADHKTAEEHRHLLRQIEDLEGRGHHECPSCHHTWAIASDAIVELQDKVDALPPYSTPPLSVSEIQVELQRVAVWDKGCAFAEFSEVPEPEWLDQINDWKLGLKDEEFRKTLPTIPVIGPDLSAAYQERLRYEQDLVRFERDTATYGVAKARVGEAQAVVASTPVVDLEPLRQLLTEIRVYDAALAPYTQLKTRFDEVMVAIAAKETDAANYLAARDAIREMKIKVKQHLVPSLNAVASKLLTEMTNGARTTVEVDEEFEITIDGQPLHTLSGSGKAVANLAIRIGLGQVLTARIFPVLMGDEIDASMDADRATSTMACIRRLGTYLKEMLLVSHKQIEADNYITV